MTYSDPIVTYSHLKITYSYPKVTYSYPQKLNLHHRQHFWYLLQSTDWLTYIVQANCLLSSC